MKINMFPSYQLELQTNAQTLLVSSVSSLQSNFFHSLDFIIINTLSFNSCVWLSKGDGRGWCRSSFEPLDDSKALPISTDAECRDYSFYATVGSISNNWFYDDTTKKITVAVPVNVRKWEFPAFLQCLN